MSEPPPLSCDRCRVPISRGAPHYDLALRLTAGFDGYLPEPAAGEEPAHALAACLALDEESLAAQVDQRFAFTVCPACRNHIALDPLQRSLAGPPKAAQ